MAFRFIHLADVHLDTPFKSRDYALQGLLRDSIRQAFKHAIDLAIKKSVHGVLAAGDLFDNDTLSFATEKFLLHEMERLNNAGIQFFYAPGNHDPWGSMYRLHRISWPENVHIFDSCEPKECIVKDKSGNEVGAIIGAGHQEKKESRNISKEFPKARPGIPYVGLVHTYVTNVNRVSGHDRYAPCSLEDLLEKGYAYWALGHVHTREVISESSTVVYPGNIVGRHPGEDGLKGVYNVEIDDEGKVDAQFNPLSPLCWCTLQVENLSCALELSSLEDIIYRGAAGQMDGVSGSVKFLPRIILKGPCPLYKELSVEENLYTLTENLKNSLNVEFLDLVVDGVVRPVNPEEYRDETHVLGTALEIYNRAISDDELLLKLAPERLAGISPGASRQEKIQYLRELLQGLDYEAASCMLRSDAK